MEIIMSLLKELYRIPVNPQDFEIEPDDRIVRNHVSVTGNFSFLSDAQYADFYKQMVSMPEFNALLEEKMAEAFRGTIWAFKSKNQQQVDSAAWIEAVETELRTKYAGANEEHQG